MVSHFNKWDGEHVESIDGGRYVCGFGHMVELLNGFPRDMVGSTGMNSRTECMNIANVILRIGPRGHVGAGKRSTFAEGR